MIINTLKLDNFFKRLTIKISNQVRNISYNIKFENLFNEKIIIADYKKSFVDFIKLGDIVLAFDVLKELIDYQAVVSIKGTIESISDLSRSILNSKDKNISKILHLISKIFENKNEFEYSQIANDFAFNKEKQGLTFVQLEKQVSLSKDINVIKNSKISNSRRIIPRINIALAGLIHSELEFSDLEIIQGLASSDSVTVKYLLKKSLPAIRSTIIKNNGTGADAQDIIQEALIIIIQKIQQNNFDIHEPLTSYLYKTCKYLWNNELNRRKSERNFKLQNQIAESDYDFESDTDSLVNVFRQCFDSMDEKSKMILTMYFNHISLSEIAVKLGYSSGDVRKKKVECMKELRNRIFSHPDYKGLF